MTISEETLMAYADGELDAATRASVEAAMQEDPDIGKRVARHRALRETMRGAFSAVLDEPVPDRLLAAARQTGAPRGAVADLSLAREAAQRKISAARGRRWQPAAMAASLLLGLALGFLAWHGPRALIEPGAGGGLVASAALAEALSSQLSDDRAAERAAIIGLSFRDKSGDYCRTFTLRGNAADVGLACRAGTDWKIRALAQAPPGAVDSGNFRTAGSQDSPAIRAAVEASIQGEPLDHAAEIAARRAGWAAAPRATE